jgi:uncharacterized protein (DUF58 family)
MIPADVLRKVRRIQITAARQVTSAFAGHYRSVFKGKGMEFEEVRQYDPGDDIRSIDWNVTARMGYPHIKKFREERELTVMFLLDLSASCHFGTVRQLKNQLAAELCALLSFCAARNNDRVGLVCFTDRIERFIPPGKGTRHLLRIIREALYTKPQSRGTDIPLAVEYLNRMMKRRTVAFILSDFYGPGIEKSLTITAKRHDLIAVTLIDPAELNLPDVGLIQLDDAETGRSHLIDTSDETLRKDYNQKARMRSEDRQRFFNSIQLDHVDVRTDTPYLPALIRFFTTRERRYSR